MVYTFKVNGSLTLRSLLLVGHSLAFSFAGPRVVFCCLAPYRQSLTVTQAAVTANVHKTFDAQLYFRLEHPFDLELFGNDRPYDIRLLVGPVLYLLVPIQIGLGQNLLGGPSANTKDVGQTDLTALVVRNINTCYTCHVILCFLIFDYQS